MSAVVGLLDQRAQWWQAEAELGDALNAVDGLGYDRARRSLLLLGPVARMAEYVDGGGDPAAYEPEITLGRELLRRVLVEIGDAPASAGAKVDRLEAAYLAWLACPEGES